MKQVLILLSITFCVLAKAQTGINTVTPKTTLDVVGKATVPTVLDGITAPRLTGEQLRAKTYGTDQTAAIVYVTEADTSPAGQTIEVTDKGYYFFDGTAWKPMVSNDWKTKGNSGTLAANNFIGTTDDVDLVFKVNNVPSGIINRTKGTAPDSGSTAFGYNALTDYGYGYNTAFGYKTLSANTTGYSNTAIGNMALANNTTGYTNVAIGLEAMKGNDTGNDNVAIGNSALQTGTGVGNVAVGSASLLNSKSGSYNTAVGIYALKEAWANNNTALGNSALQYLTYGSQNIGIGNSVGLGLTGDIATNPQTITTGTNNIVIGNNVSVVDGTASRQLNIGDWIYGNDGRIGIGPPAWNVTKMVIPSTDRLNVFGRAQFYEESGGCPNCRVIVNPAQGEISLSSSQGQIYSLTSGSAMDANGGTYLGGFMIQRGTTSAPQLQIFDTGNIVIGGKPTVAPTAKLEILGKIKAVDVNFSGLRVYESEASAVGLTSGDMYKTATGELRIKL
jgi:hypothetical protein